MKVLLYNWVSFDDEKGRGGGVTVYLKNLISHVKEYINVGNTDLEITFLYSGTSYDIYDRSIRYERIEQCKECPNYTIVNSSVFAPAYLSFPQIDTVLNDTQLKETFVHFLEEKGPFDVVHFHNLEGLSLKVLEAKELFPETKFIYTIHNYYAFCPQVNLWQKEQRCCRKENTDAECYECMKYHVPLKKLEHKMAMNYTLQKRYSDVLKKAYLQCGEKIDECYREEEFGEVKSVDKERIERVLSVYRNEFVTYINKYIDVVLGVSKRVCDIAKKMQIDEAKIRVSYIGTKAAENAKDASNATEYQNGIELIYLGYKRPDKGYFFLLDVLDNLSESIAKEISVTIAAKQLPDYDDRKIDVSKFRNFTTMNGYNREALGELLKGKHLGIVPVLWEDNLPQVAIEMVAEGVPIIASDRGGASELGNNELFCFEAGNVKACCDRIAYFVEKPERIQSFWDEASRLVTMKEHMSELLEIYGER